MPDLRAGLRAAERGHRLEAVSAAVYLAVASTAYFYFAFRGAAGKSFWYDEIVTIFAARQGGPVDICRALLGGLANHPPLDFIVRHYAAELFGFSEIGFRVPSILAAYAAFVSTYLYARAAYSRAAGIAASAVFLMSTFVAYSVEARGYALMLAFAGLALLLFRRVVREPGCPLWVVAVLAVAQAFTVYTHFYGVLLFAAMAAGMIALYISERRIAWRLLFALAAGSLLTVPLIPFAAAARQYSGHFWTPVPSNALTIVRDVVSTYQDGYVILLAIGGPAVLARPWLRGARRQLPLRINVAEWTTLSALLLMPVWQWMLAHFVTGAYLPKYTIFSVLGGSILLGVLLAWSVSRLDRFATTLLAIFCAAGVITSLPAAERLGWSTLPRTQSAIRQLEETASRSPLPIVAPHANTYLVLYYYGSPALKARLLLLSDPEASLRFAHMDNNEIEMRGVAKFEPIRFVPYRSLVPKSARLLLTDGRYDIEDWVYPKLIEDGYRMQLANELPFIKFHCERDRRAVSP